MRVDGCEGGATPLYTRLALGAGIGIDCFLAAAAPGGGGPTPFQGPFIPGIAEGGDFTIAALGPTLPGDWGRELSTGTTPLRGLGSPFIEAAERIGKGPSTPLPKGGTGPFPPADDGATIDGLLPLAIASPR